MNQKVTWTILFLIAILYKIFWGAFSKSIPSNFNILLWIGWGIIWLVIIILTIRWWPHNENKNLALGPIKNVPLKRQAEMRVQAAEDMGVISAGVWVGYILGFICIGMGILSLFSKPLNLGPFFGMTILGLIVIAVIFFINRSRKRKAA